MKNYGKTRTDVGKEIDAYVLFIDIVGFSKRNIVSQQKIIDKLIIFVNRALRQFIFDRINKYDPVRLPTGDGMALVFQIDDQAPVRCAWFITKFIDKYNAKECKKKIEEKLEFNVRMGIHAAKVRRIRNLKLNFAGPALNDAERVMSCGGPKHILVSSSYYEAHLKGIPPFHDLEMKEEHYFVKGGREAVCNLYGKLWIGEHEIDAGNPELPESKPFIDKTSIPIHYSIPERYGDRSPLAFFLCSEFYEGLNALQQMKLIKGDKILPHIRATLREHVTPSNPKGRMELISLIHPSKWETELWPKYHIMIINITTKHPKSLKEMDAKRIHILSLDMKDNLEVMKRMVALAICEFIGNIKCRIIFIDPDKLIYDEVSGIYSLSGFSLLDYGTYRTQMRKDIIFSNIVPYFTDNEESKEWGITRFLGTEDRDQIYHALQGNFYRAWDNLVPDHGYSFPELIKEFGQIDGRINKEVLEPVIRYIKSLKFECRVDELNNSLNDILPIIMDSRQKLEEKESVLLRRLSKDAQKILG